MPNLSNVTFKRDPFLLGFAAVLVVVAGVLVVKNVVTWKEAALFLTGVFALPGLFGMKQPDDKSSSLPPGPATVVFVIAFAIVTQSACVPKKEMTTEEKHVAAETTYGAMLQACIHDHPGWKGADECKAKVDAYWADAGTKEGGGK